jgi:hypothetical protein
MSSNMAAQQPRSSALTTVLIPGGVQLYNIQFHCHGRTPSPVACREARIPAATPLNAAALDALESCVYYSQFVPHAEPDTDELPLAEAERWGAFETDRAKLAAFVKAFEAPGDEALAAILSRPVTAGSSVEIECDVVTYHWDYNADGPTVTARFVATKPTGPFTVRDVCRAVAAFYASPYTAEEAAALSDLLERAKEPDMSAVPWTKIARAALTVRGLIEGFAAEGGRVAVLRAT